MLSLFYPSAINWMWNYCTYLGPFIASDGSKYDLGIFENSAAIVYGNEPGNYYSGELDLFSQQIHRPKDEAYEETRKRARMLGLYKKQIMEKKLSDLTLTELLLLHNNYIVSTDRGARYSLINKWDFEELEKELQKRLKQIKFQFEEYV